MTKFKGTKGKWTVEQLEHIDSTYVWFEDFKGHIQLWHHHGDSATKEEAIANALLISKAPEMFDILEHMYKEYSNNERITGSLRDYMIKIGKLIKEATEL